MEQELFQVTSKALSRGVALHFSDVNYEVKGKQILKSVFGSVERGELMAIMVCLCSFVKYLEGPTGCGKSTLLDVLAGKKLYRFKRKRKKQSGKSDKRNIG